MPRLSTTSVALLGLLHLRPHTAYDLAQQAARSLSFVWQTSTSQLYAEPRRLAELGLVSATQEPAGPRRRRTVYAITDEGRAALRDWLATPPRPPRWEDEVLLRVMLADAAGLDELRGTLQAHRAALEEVLARGQRLIREQLDGSAPYQERANLNVLWWEYRAEQVRLALAWLDRVEAEVAGWSSTEPKPFDERTRAVAERLAGLPR